MRIKQVKPDLLRSKKLKLGLILCSFLLAPINAWSLDFSFEFDSSFSDNDRFFQGTAKGRILGLGDNGTYAASQVFIDLAPAGVLLAPGSTEVTAYTVVKNWVTVVNKQITNLDILAAGNWGSDPVDFFTFELNQNGYQSFIWNNAKNKFVLNQQGLQGIRFNLVSDDAIENPLSPIGLTSPTPPDAIPPTDPSSGIPGVPGPLPLLGAAVAWNSSRRLRQRIRSVHR